MIYSYLKASIGSIFAAFTAGAYPDTTPTMKHTTIPVITHIHGITKLDFSIDETSISDQDTKNYTKYTAELSDHY